MRPKLTFNKMRGHLHTIHLHRKWVRHYCFLAGIKWRGLVHDLSKYNPIEFFESACYWNGTSTPIVEAKKNEGISYAWLHHKGHNSHHYEYWMDNFDDGGIARLIPEKDFVELVCDYLAAAHSYNSTFSYAAENEWWQKRREHCSMNYANKIMLDSLFSILAIAEKDSPTNPDYLPPETLIKYGIIQEIWRTNKDVAENK